jgi:hypothetical protein
MPVSLAEEAKSFATRIERLLNGTVTSDAAVTVLTSAPDVAIVVAGLASTVPEANRTYVPLSTSSSATTREEAKLWLKAFFSVRLDDEGEHLAVAKSGFGLCVNRSNGLCPIRLEYDRDKTAKAPAHVQIHGESAGLGWAFAAAGAPMKRLEDLHIPVGHRRFRPTLEDFIEFLHQEGLLTDLHSGWRAVRETSRGDWEGRQLRAAVRRNPEPAAEQLRGQGWTVEPPA